MGEYSCEEETAESFEDVTGGGLKMGFWEVGDAAGFEMGMGSVVGVEERDREASLSGLESDNGCDSVDDASDDASVDWTALDDGDGEGDGEVEDSAPLSDAISIEGPEIGERW